MPNTNTPAPDPNRLEWNGRARRPTSRYPTTFLVDDQLNFAEGVVDYIKTWVKTDSKPIKNLALTPEREALVLAQFRVLLAFLNLKYGVDVAVVRGNNILPNSFASYYNLATNTIHLSGRFSLLTFLHEYAHARGMGEEEAVLWSCSLFKRCLPRTFATLIPSGHAMMRNHVERGEPDNA